jgi:putative transposase
MKFRLVRELADDGIAVAVACRVLGVSTSGFYDWRDRPPSAREVADTELTAMITEIHAWSRRSYGSPQIHQELRQGRGIRCGRKRVERLMRGACIQGSYRRKGHRHKPLPPTHEDLVARRFTVDAPNKLWVTDITEHPTAEGKVYAAVVLDAFSRRVIGLSIADHLRSEIVVDALEMARWRRGDVTGTIVHSDHGSQYTSWVFGQRLRAAGLLGSMGRIGSALDNAMAESFFSRLQLDLLDTQIWRTRAELAAAIFEWIEAWYNPHRRHSSLGYLSPVEFERRNAEEVA